MLRVYFLFDIYDGRVFPMHFLSFWTWITLTTSHAMFSQLIQQIRMYGKIKEWDSCPSNAKRVSARLPKSPNLQLLFEMRFVLLTNFFLLVICYLYSKIIDADVNFCYLWWWQVGKILLNALLYPGIKTNQQKNSIVAIFHTAVRKLYWKIGYYVI